MIATDISEDNQENPDCLFETSEALLRSEIGFWKDMIDSDKPAYAPATIERMEQALALAELRLTELLGKYQQKRRKNEPAPGNVYFIGRHC